MNPVDMIKKLCAEKGISIAQLEKELGYSNGSISKSNTIKSDRLYEISQYFNKPMEYFVTGENVEYTVSYDFMNGASESQKKRIMEYAKFILTQSDIDEMLEDVEEFCERQDV